MPHGDACRISLYSTEFKTTENSIKRLIFSCAAHSVREVTLKSRDSRYERCMQEGVLGLGPQTEYLFLSFLLVY